MPSRSDKDTGSRASRSAGAGAERGQGAESDAGTEPDARFTFANERTFLAWNRTALALIAGGLAVAQFLKLGLSGAQLIVALPLIGFGAYMSLSSYRTWQRNQRALRLGQPLPASALPRILLYGVSVFAVAATALAILHFE
jgi:putative membrane protein